MQVEDQFSIDSELVHCDLLADKWLYLSSVHLRSPRLIVFFVDDNQHADGSKLTEVTVSSQSNTLKLDHPV